MSASKEAKAKGFKSLQEVSRMLGESESGHPIVGFNTLKRWHKNKPKLFNAVLDGLNWQITYKSEK